MTKNERSLGGLSSASISADMSSDTKPGTTGKLLKDISSAGSLGLSISGHSPQASLSSAGIALSLMDDTKDQNHSSVAGIFSLLGSSAGTDPNLAAALRNSFEFNTVQTEAVVMPLLASLKNSEIVNEPQRVEVADGKLRVGSVTVNASVYNGKEAYTITNAAFSEPQIINRGDKLLSLHVNQGGKVYANMEPLARIKAIKKDFQELLSLLNKPNSFDLPNDQVEKIKQLSSAPIIGVSHLVKLIAAKGLPTWSIKDLPKAVQIFHKFDSQAVSNLFGGKRKVSEQDVQVMFLPASMRSQVV